MIGNLSAARLAQDCIDAAGSNQILRDAAVIKYSRLSDAIIADLGRLSETGTLGKIALFLCKKDRV